MEELWILIWTVIRFQLKSPLQLPSGSIKSHYYGWRKKFTTYKSCLPNKSDCYFLQIWTHKGRVKKNSHGVKRWIKKTRMSADNLQKVESHLDIWRNFWKAKFFSELICSILLLPLAQYWGQSVICDYHHSLALIGWLPFSSRRGEGDAMMEKKFIAA